jgi:hypothetical protein
MFGRVADDTPLDRLEAERARAAAERVRLTEALETIHAATPIEEIMHGDCRGADRLAAEWAGRKGIPISAYPADWDNIDLPGAKIRMRNGRPYDATAGFRRNIRMLLEGAPQLVIAFPGGPGTDHMVAQALKRNFAVLSVDA